MAAIEKLDIVSGSNKRAPLAACAIDAPVASDPASVWANQLLRAVGDADSVLLCGESRAARAVARRLEGRVRVLSPAEDERAIAFVDREAGKDAQDRIGGVLYVGESLSRPAAATLSRDLRAVMDRCFHDANVFVGLVDGDAAVLSEQELACGA